MAALTLSSPNALLLCKPVTACNRRPLSMRSSPSNGFSNLCLGRTHSSSSFNFNPLRVSIEQKEVAVKRQSSVGAAGAVCYAPILAPRNLQWISAIFCVVLTLAKGTAIQKSFLVPFFTLQAPAGVISWMKGEYGAWAAFLALIVRLFLYIPVDIKDFLNPGELELPLMALLLVIVAPHQVINLRGTKEGVIISLLLAVYLAFQHFSRIGLEKVFDQGSLVATAGILGITIASFCLLI